MDVPKRTKKRAQPQPLSTQVPPTLLEMTASPQHIYRLEIQTNPYTGIQQIQMGPGPYGMDVQLVRKRVERMNLHLGRTGARTRFLVTGLLWIMATASTLLLYTTKCQVRTGWCTYDLHIAVPSVLLILLLLFNLITYHQALHRARLTMQAILQEFQKRDPSMDWILRDTWIEICVREEHKVEEVVVHESALTLDMSFQEDHVYSSHSSICF
jgi:hypothetical protein